MENEEQETDTRLTLRVPANLIHALRQSAKQNDRSVNAEIIRAIKEHLGEQEKRVHN